METLAPQRHVLRRWDIEVGRGSHGNKETPRNCPSCRSPFFMVSCVAEFYPLVVLLSRISQRIGLSKSKRLEKAVRCLEG